MLSNVFARIAARVVLVTYITQLIAPVVYACETIRPDSTLGMSIHDRRVPSPPRERWLQESFQQSLGFKPRVQTLKPFSDLTNLFPDEQQACIQAQTYQYSLNIQTSSLKNERFKLELSRKTKDSQGPFERLYTDSIRQGKLTSSSSEEDETQDDALLNLFQGAAVHKFSQKDSPICFCWQIGNAILKVSQDGTVFFDEGSVPLLSSYDLVLKTSGELFLLSLGVEKLTLQSPTKIVGAVVADCLQIDHMDKDKFVVNEGGLQVKKLIGNGTLINHALLNLEGTAEAPAVMGVHQVMNKRVEGSAKEAKIQSPHLQITPENRHFINGAGTEFRVGKLIANPSSIATDSFINNGNVYLGQGTLNRQAINRGYWEAHKMTVMGKPLTNKGNLNIWDEMVVTSYLSNDGDMKVKNFLKLTKGKNTGTIKGDKGAKLELHVEEELINDGKITLEDIWFLQGNTSFVNGVNGIVNASIIGEDLSASINPLSNANRTLSPFFQNKGKINASSLFTDHRLAENSGTINIKCLFSCQGVFDNAGTLDTPLFTLEKGKFHNKKTGTLIVHEKMNVQDSTIQNDGHLQTELDRKGGGGFLQQSGEFINQGTWNHRGNVDLGSTVLRNMGSILWQNGTWNSTFRDYMNVQGTWVLDNIVCPQTISFTNYGTLQCNNSTFNFSHFKNHGKTVMNGGQYSTTYLLNSNSYGKGVISFEGQSCAFKVGNLTQQGEIKIDPRINQSISIHTGNNDGKIIGPNLTLNVGNSFVNTCDFVLKDLIGTGRLINKRQLIFTGTAEAPSQLGINIFENGDELSTSAKVAGSHIKVTEYNKQFTIQEQSNIIVTSLTFSPLAGNPFTGPAVTPTFMNKGYIQADEQIVIHRQGMMNGGAMRTLKLTVSGWQFENAKGAYLYVDQNINSDVTVLSNDGEMVTKGKFAQQTGEFINAGGWNHTGDIDLGYTQISNRGTMQWHKGKWDFTPSIKYTNAGTWFFDQMTCFNNISLTNHGILGLMGGTLSFCDLINHNTVELYAGQYAITHKLEHYGTIKFLQNDWVFTDNEHYTAPNQLLLNNGTIYGFISPGQIEHTHHLTYDVQTLPKTIQSKGMLEFTRRWSWRSLDDLNRINAPQSRVRFFCSGGWSSLSTTQNYEFSNIGHLDLYINDKFKVLHELKAPILTLQVNGALILGQDNDRMGVIAATKGELWITAHTIDGRFGKIYGAGLTALSSARGDILVGSPVRGVGPIYSSITYPATLSDRVMNVTNGAFVSSGGTLILESTHDILIRYGTLISGSTLSLRSLENIENLASIIYSMGPARFQAHNYEHIRDAFPLKRNYVECAGYGDQHNSFPGSGPAIIESLVEVEFLVQNMRNMAGHIKSGGRICINNNTLKTGICGYFEESIPLINYALFHGSVSQYVYAYEGCILQSAEAIQMNLGGFRITGCMNAPIISIQSRGDGLFSCKFANHKNITLTEARLVDMYEWIQNYIQGCGFFFQKANDEIVSEFPLGRPYVPQPHQQVILSHPSLPSPSSLTHGLNPVMGQGCNYYPSPRSINPLRSLDLNLWIQQALSYNLGKVHVRDHLGRRIFGDNLVPGLWNNAAEWRKKNKKAIMSKEDLANISTAMLLYGFQQQGNILHQLTYLALPPSEFEDAQKTWADVIDVSTEGDLTFQDTTMRAKHLLKLYSGGKLSFLSSVKTHEHANGTHQTVDNPTDVECTEGVLTAIGRTGFQMTGAKLRSLLELVAGSTEGNTDIQNIQLKRTDNHTHVKKGGFFEGDTVVNETHTTSSNVPSQLTSAIRSMTVLCGEDAKTSITASYLKALETITFLGKELETNADMGVDSIKTESQTDSPFSTSRTTRVQQAANNFQTVIDAKVIHTDTKKATYNGTDFIADVLYDNTEKGAVFGFTLATLESFYQTITESAFAKSDVGCKGGCEVMVPCRLEIKKIIRSIEDGEIQLNSAIWDKNRTQIIGKFAETTYQLKQWQESWANHEQAIPNEAMVVVALAITIATQGMGVTALAPLLNGVTAVTGMQLSAMGIVMVNAGFSTFLSTAATSGLRTGDLAQVGKDLTSASFAKTIGISMLSAGLCQQLGKVLNIDANPSLKEVLNPGAGKPVFTDFLQSQALKSSINAGLNMGINGDSAHQALITAARDVAINSAAAWASYTIGDMGSQGKWTPDQQDLAHTGIGALFGVATHLDKPLEGAITGGLNAFAAARASRIMFGSREELKAQAEEELRQQDRPVREETVGDMMNDLLHQKTALITLLSASTTAAITKDPSMVSTSIGVTMNVTENNCIPSMTKSLMAAECQPEFIQKKEGFWKDEFDDPDDLYFEMVRKGNKENSGYGGGNYHDEFIEDAHDTFKNPKAGLLEKWVAMNSIPIFLEAKGQTAIGQALCTEIEYSKQRKTEIEQWSSKGLIYSVSNANNRNVSAWSQAYSSVNAFMYNNINLLASFIPVTYGETILTFAPVAGSAPVVKAAQFIKPANLFRGATRTRGAAIIPQQEVRLLSAQPHGIHGDWGLVPVNQNTFYLSRYSERSIDVQKLISGFSENGGMPKPLPRQEILSSNQQGQPQLRLVEGSQKHVTERVLTKNQPLTIRPGQEWKLKIKGNAQKTKTPGHALESTKQAIREAKDPEIGTVYLNSGYHKALREHGISTKLESNRLPDVLAVSKDAKKMRATEMQSKSDDPRKLEGRNLKVGEQLKTDGIILEVDVRKIPTWDYEKGMPK